MIISRSVSSAFPSDNRNQMTAIATSVSASSLAPPAGRLKAEAARRRRSRRRASCFRAAARLARARRPASIHYTWCVSSSGAPNRAVAMQASDTRRIPRSICVRIFGLTKGLTALSSARFLWVYRGLPALCDPSKDRHRAAHEIGRRVIGVVGRRRRAPVRRTAPEQGACCGQRLFQCVRVVHQGGEHIVFGHIASTFLTDRAWIAAAQPALRLRACGGSPALFAWRRLGRPRPAGLDGLADARCGLRAYALCQGASLLALQKLGQRAHARVVLRQIELM